MHRTTVRLLVTAAAILVVGLSQAGTLDRAGKEYTEEGFKRALVAYGVARGLNGVISVAQGTEVAVEPAGVGVNFKPGEILDPLNDLIEGFSWVMLVSGTSLGIQRVMLDVAAYAWFGAIVAVAALASVCVAWWPRRLPARVRSTAYRIALAVVVVRFAVPLIAIANEAIYSAFLEPQYAESTAMLEKTAKAVEAAGQNPAPAAPDTEPSMLDGALRAYRAARDAIDVQGRIAAVKAVAADAGQYAIDLIVVFVLQTILFPLGFLWLTLQILKRCLRVPPPRATD